MKVFFAMATYVGYLIAHYLGRLRGYMKERLSMLVCAAGIAASAPVLAAGDDWKHLNRSDLPGRVAAVVFSNGVLDDSTSLRWGRWTVALDARAVAKLGQDDDDVRTISIDSLSCSNDVAGKHECSMTLIRFKGSTAKELIRRGAEDTHCSVYSKDQVSMNIGCPTEVRFR